MTRRIARIPLRSGGCLLLLMLLAGLLPTQAHAQVSVNVHIGPPPPVIVAAPPPMLLLPEPGIYVAAGIPYDVFFVGGRYYYVHGDHWFWGPGYAGPWTYVEYRSLPPGLRRYKVVKLREYREREYNVYRVQGANFRGEHFYAVKDEHDHHDHDDHDHGNGNGNGRGRGHHKDDR
jgi:hypothetical protein